MVEEKVSILKHSLVPEHVILSDAEKKEILKKLDVVQAQLPKILKNDPVVKEIGAKEGDVIKIIRKSYTAGVSVYYRTVIKGVL